MSDQIDGDIFKVVASGQPFKPSARRDNLVSEMLKQFVGKRSGAAGDPSAHQASEIPGTVEVTNSSGSAVDAFGVLGISGVAITHAENGPLFETRIMLTGDTPAAVGHRGKFVVTAEPLADGQIGRCYAQGIFPAQVNIVSSAHRYCDVKDGDATQLESGAIGSAQILYAPGGTGTKWCIIRMGVELVHISGLITSDGAEDALYNGKSYVPGTPTASLPGTLVGTEDCLVWNLAEYALTGGTGHDVTASDNDDGFAKGFTGVVVGYDEATGKKIVHATVYWTACAGE